ncbi:MAG: DNA-3-methyladenine glycosylase I [Bacteroidetes bacterium]|nr:DNA-3-methyladenine glycosylase I [Bacteroidota bacterium]
MIKRCEWCESTDLMRAYHDTEWGTPVHDEQRHFEFLVLEFMQAGLSWSTILNKRENFRKAFNNFAVEKVVNYGSKKIASLLQDAGIIRNRLKIAALINNAGKFIEVQKEFGTFDAYIWHFTNGKVVNNKITSLHNMQVTSELSDMVSRDLKKRGFKFVGSTTLYAHLQAIGVINDHITSCFRYKELTTE